MNTNSMSWNRIESGSIRLIKVCREKLVLIYENDAEICLEFDDAEQLDKFINRLLARVQNEDCDFLKWN